MLRYLDNMRTLIMIKKSGFTLAEVLTTLMVIGVVAAMTIPTLMNSTNDQQLKVAYKKALSVLGQGVQLMTAKEEQCIVNNSNTLAQCFQQKVLSGNIDGSKVTTSDGMVYNFIYDTNNGKIGNQGDAAQARTIEDICGDIAQVNGYNASNGRCAVIVDVNGLGKGSRSFTTTTYANIQNLNTSDQIPIVLTGTGVKPFYFSSSSGHVNDLYKTMFNTTP